MHKPSDLDVLVVGAGPTGLTLALELARRGTSVRIIDKAREPTKLSKAIVMHARTLEVLEPEGTADAMVAAGLPLRNVTMWAEGEAIVRASFDELDSRYPFLLSISQAETERVLCEQLARHQRQVERGAELVSFEDRGDHVLCVVRGPDGEHSVEARYLVGCDGAKSTVRKGLGLTFSGSTYDERFLLGDVVLSGDVHSDELRSYFGEDGLVALFPMRGGRFRIIATARPDDLSEDAPSPDELIDLARARSGASLAASDPTWLARFRIHCRQVDQYGQGRVLVAGDAAHIHSPAGGQGMNTGIQDAHNLAWKLGLAARGRATPALLESYGVERHGVGQAVLRGTDFATKVGTLRGRVARTIRNQAARFLSSFELVQQRIVKQVSELTIGYESSPIVSQAHASLWTARFADDASDERPSLPAWRHFELGPKPGAFAPDAHLRRESDGASQRLKQVLDPNLFNLLLFDGQAKTPEGYAKLVAIARRVERQWPRQVAVTLVTPGAERPDGVPSDLAVVLDEDGELEERYGAQAECLYLLRPDGYVSFKSQPAEESSLLSHLAALIA